MQPIYYEQLHLQRLLHFMESPADMISVHEDYLRGMELDDFVSAYHALHRMFMQVYSDMLADPGGFGLPLYKIGEGLNSEKTKVWHISGMLFTLGVCGELGDMLYVNTNNYIATLKKRFKITSAMTVLRRLSDYGFVFDFGGSTSFTVDYPDDRRILNVVAAFGRKMSFLSTYNHAYPMHCLNPRCFEETGAGIPGGDCDYMALSEEDTHPAAARPEPPVKTGTRGKTALVTGGASGIGRASALAFARAGAKVFIIDIDETGASAVVDEITNLGGTAAFCRADVTKEKEVAAAIDACVSRFGALDYAHNNAGIAISASTVDCTEEIWQKVIDTNLKGYWLCMKYELLQMRRRGFGSIVNTSSISGLIGRAGDMPYNVSKHGIIGLTKTAALENAALGIRVNAVCPGAIQTPWVRRVTKGLNELHPMNRIGQPEEVANAVVWLCGDGASFITGHSLVIDGGRIAGEW